MGVRSEFEKFVNAEMDKATDPYDVAWLAANWMAERCAAEFDKAYCGFSQSDPGRPSEVCRQLAKELESQ